LLAAKLFLRGGFEIHAKAETGIKGQDFDFSAWRNGDEINAEVTVLTAKQFYLKTILNALNQNRKQLPDNRPSVIFCTLPEEWDKCKVNLNFAVMMAAFQFFSTTRRVNAIVFSMERHQNITPDGSKGVFSLILKPFMNPRARFRLKDEKFLFDGIPLSYAARKAFKRPQSLAETPEKVDVIADEFRISDFFRWVDHLVPRSG